MQIGQKKAEEDSKAIALSESWPIADGTRGTASENADIADIAAAAVEAEAVVVVLEIAKIVGSLVTPYA